MYLYNCNKHPMLGVMNFRKKKGIKKFQDNGSVSIPFCLFEVYKQKYLIHFDMCVILR